MGVNKNKELKSQLLFSWIDDSELRYQLSLKVLASKNKRIESQKEISKTLGISLTKIKEIENGTCKDFNSINNYINYFSEHLIKIDNDRDKYRY
jgi:predicted XRE-type DNA-binding protein